MSFAAAGLSPTDVNDKENIAFQKAALFVCDTDEHLFLTGKAGSGKTTFLKFIRTQTKKRCAVVAPTGIAAINAGGETIHSFLQLPLGPFVPGNAGGFGNQPEYVSDKHSLLARLRLRETKLELLRKLELLIIDEVSMVRADLLDAMDLVLRHVRRKHDVPFGGLQMVYIGDLFQLPPVVQQNDWEILSQFYRGAYFFDSLAIQQRPPLYIELTKIYRQKDIAFIDLLNRIRIGETIDEDIRTLNARYDADTGDREGYIVLSTHNATADRINLEALERLPSALHKFEGKIQNEFNLKNVPVELELNLKVGAQVMFIKNDVQTPRRYYNGKIGVIKSLTKDEIKVSFPGEKNPESIRVEQETWKNIRYALDSKTGNVVEDELGSFSQFPIRLAWAITVHKSQGLTLDKAIVDLNQSFACGQVYVALSRCTSMEGLILRSRLNHEAILVDRRVQQFAELASDEDELDARYEYCKRKSFVNTVVANFDFSGLMPLTEKLFIELEKRKSGPAVIENKELSQKILEDIKAAQANALKFHRQIQLLFENNEDARINERVNAAGNYFSGQIFAPILSSIDTQLAKLGDKPGVTKQVKLWKTYKTQLTKKIEEMKM